MFPSSFPRFLLLLTFLTVPSALGFLHVAPHASAAHAKAKLSPRQSTTSTASTACADIFSSDYYYFTAKYAYDCLTSVPFNATVATQLIQYYRDTLQFQSTLAYLKNPPSSYQQPAVDLLAGLDLIQRDIQVGVFDNEYTFEAALQTLLYSAHDAHISLYGGALSVFSFGSPLRIVSVSSDGIALPKVFIIDDLIEAASETVDWNPSAVSTINGVNTTNFLSQFAALNALGTLEPNADWNQLMSSPAADIQGLLSAFEGSSIFYPGENITFAFENGTVFESPWIATYTIPADTPIISSGEDFYTWFVLGEYPTTTATAATSAVSAAAATSSAAASSAPSSTSSSQPAPTSWEYSPYPSNPVVVQPNLGELNGGVITGYFLNDGTTAILSIPSFEVTSETIQSFSSTIGDFISKSKAAGKTKIIIDVQENGGGGYLLATDAFKQFFPAIDPFGGGRYRAHKTADALGTTYTDFQLSQPTNDTYFAEAWTATTYLNAETGQDFRSWAEFYGPHKYNGDYFTTTQRNNLSSIIFDENASGGIVVYGYANRTATSPQPFAADDIVILTDSYCHSACAVFVEMMHHEAGVRTVVAGGRPEMGPMQAVSGSRGSEAYSNSDLDQDMQSGVELNSSLAEALPDRNVDFWVTYAGFNLRDQVRRGETVPLQFTYEPADCRIFYTPRTVYNFENLWNYVIDAVWRNPSLCVQGSISPSTGTNTTGPAADPNPQAVGDVGSVVALTPGTNDISTPTNYDGNNVTDANTFNNFVDAGVKSSGDCSVCDRTSTCVPVKSCSRGAVTAVGKQCRRTCNKLPNTNQCGNGNHCELLTANSGYCESDAVIFSLRSCSTPTNPKKPSSTNKAGGLPNNLPYALPGSKPKPQYSGGGGIGKAVRAGISPWE